MPHCELEQTGVPPGAEGQTLPQAPQFCGSLVVGMHAPPQSELPGLQAKPHLAELHVRRALAGAGGQTLPQAPQLSGSLERSTQALVHSVAPGLQVFPHCPLPHDAQPLAGGAQVLAQEPQWSGSESSETHCPSQQAAPAGH